MASTMNLPPVSGGGLHSKSDVTREKETVEVMDTGDDFARFDAVTKDEATDLLRTHQVGRVAWDSAEGPVILPVAYAWRDGAIAFRTADFGALAALVNQTDVAFQIDEFDMATATGWSVLVRATSSAVTQATEIVGWLTRLPAPWAPGDREILIRLDPVSVTGRVVSRG